MIFVQISLKFNSKMIVPLQDVFQVIFKVEHLKIIIDCQFEDINTVGDLKRKQGAFLSWDECFSSPEKLCHKLFNIACRFWFSRQEFPTLHDRTLHKRCGYKTSSWQQVPRSIFWGVGSSETVECQWQNQRRSSSWRSSSYYVVTTNGAEQGEGEREANKAWVQILCELSNSWTPPPCWQTYLATKSADPPPLEMYLTSFY